MCQVSAADRCKLEQARVRVKKKHGTCCYADRVAHPRKRNPKLTPAALLQWRLSQGLTQEQLGQLLGIRQQTVHQYEAGVRAPPWYYGLALNWLRQLAEGTQS